MPEPTAHTARDEGQAAYKPGDHCKVEGCEEPFAYDHRCERHTDADEGQAAYQPVRNPLWLLDVDGVINAVCGSVPLGYKRERINGYSITWNPEVIRRMRQLHETGAVEIRWLTTWCDDAANLIAPGLGLPLDCAVEGADDHKADLPGWWKAVAAKRLSDAEPERALIWTDDDLDYAERNGEVDWLRERTGPTYAYSPAPGQGITPKHLARIEAFIDRVRFPSSEASA